jgi:excisionase family DNA binding protein
MVASRNKSKTVTVIPSPANGNLKQQKAALAPVATAEPSPAVEQEKAPVARLALSVEETAASAGLSERYVWDLVKSGALRTKRFGRRRLVPVAALEEFLK